MSDSALNGFLDTNRTQISVLLLVKQNFQHFAGKMLTKNRKDALGLSQMFRCSMSA